MRAQPATRGARRSARVGFGAAQDAAETDCTVAAMPFVLRVNPSGQQYRLPLVGEAERTQLVALIAQGLGERRCVTVTFELGDVPDMFGVLFLNGNVVESVELFEVADQVRSDQ